MQDGGSRVDDVQMRGLGDGLFVVTPDGGEHGGVLVDDGLAALKGGEGEGPERQDVGAEVAEHALEADAFGVGEDLVVEGGVEALHLGEVVDAVAHVFDEGFELLEFVRLHAAAGAERGDLFERLANLEDAEDLFGFERADDGAACAARFEHAFGFEAAKGFADRSAAGAEAGGDVELDDGGAGGNLAGEDHGAETVVDLVAEWAWPDESGWLRGLVRGFDDHP